MKDNGTVTSLIVGEEVRGEVVDGAAGIFTNDRRAAIISRIAAGIRDIS